MKKTFLVMSVVALFLASISLFTRIKSETRQENESYAEDYVPNELLVKFDNDIGKYAIQDAINYLQGKVISYLGSELNPDAWDPSDLSVRSFRLDPNLLHIRVPEVVSIDQAIDLLYQRFRIEYAEKNLIFHACATPNDPLRQFQWGLGKIHAYDAWDITTGSPNIVIAVIDTGINYNHEDLKDYNSSARIWKNEDEIPGNGIDDDSNGYKDDYRGWNFVENNNDIWDDDALQKHGTMNAGIIGAWTNTTPARGIAGVDWNAKIMVIKGLDSNASISLSSVVNAIDYATENGAHISSNSYGIDIEPRSTEGAIARAMNEGRLFIAAAGNYSNQKLKWWDNDQRSVYPASHDIDNIISVAYTNGSDALDGDSHYGLYSVDLAAPGRDIYSTAFGENDYRYLSGTSQATPFVAGVAGLLWARRPGLNWWKAKTIILKSVDKLSSLTGKVGSGGRLNAYAALSMAIPNLPTAPSNLNAQAFGCDVKLTWTDNSNNESGFYVYRKTGNIYIQMGYTGPNETTYWDLELPSGTYYYYVRAYNGDGTSQKTLVKSIKLTGC